MKSKSQILKPILSYWMALILISLLTLQAVAAATTGAVGVKAAKQEKSNWCWAASGVAVLYRYGKDVSQTNFSLSATGGTSNTAQSVDTVKSGLKKFSISSSSTSALTFTQVKTEINNSRPIIVGLTYLVGGGHMVVLNGWDTSSGTNKVQYMDPASGKYVVKTYTWLKSNSTWTWKQTIYKISK